MYKALKENKIIAINEKEYFPCLICDEVVEDTEHNLEDYAQYEGEFILKENIPAPTEEEQKKIEQEHINKKLIQSHLIYKDYVIKNKLKKLLQRLMN